jgi:hypothetical protein
MLTNNFDSKEVSTAMPITIVTGKALRSEFAGARRRRLSGPSRRLVTARPSARLVTAQPIARWDEAVRPFQDRVLAAERGAS